jgi:hypothetical protein
LIHLARKLHADAPWHCTAREHNPALDRVSRQIERDNAGAAGEFDSDS